VWNGRHPARTVGRRYQAAQWRWRPRTLVSVWQWFVNYSHQLCVKVFNKSDHESEPRPHSQSCDSTNELAAVLLSWFQTFCTWHEEQRISLQNMSFCNFLSISFKATCKFRLLAAGGSGNPSQIWWMKSTQRDPALCTLICRLVVQCLITYSGESN
jgi:hypothetical protein